MSNETVKFTGTEQSAKLVFARYPMPRATRKEISERANNALWEKWEAEAPARLTSKGDSFNKWTAFTRRYPSLTRLAMFTPIEPDSMAAVEVEGT
jgi:hypothetical protein